MNGIEKGRVCKAVCPLVSVTNMLFRLTARVSTSTYGREFQIEQLLLTARAEVEGSEV